MPIDFVESKVDFVPEETEQKPPVVRQTEPGAVAPTNLVPAIRLMGGELALGREGDTHNDIIQREDLRPEQIDQRGFSDLDGKQFFDRETAAKGTQLPTEFEQGRLHSTDLPQRLVAPFGGTGAAFGGLTPEQMRELPSPTQPLIELPRLPSVEEREPTTSEKILANVNPVLLGAGALLGNKPVVQAMRSLANLPIGLAEFMLSPVGAATPVAAAVAPTATAAAFAGQMAKDLGTQLGVTSAEWDKMTVPQRVDAVVNIGGTAAFAAMLARQPYAKAAATFKVTPRAQWQGPLATGEVLKTPEGARPVQTEIEIKSEGEPTPEPPAEPTPEPKPLPSEPGEAQPSAVAPAAPAVVSAEKAPAVTGVEPAIRQPITDGQKTQLKQLGLRDKEIADLQSGTVSVSDLVARKLPSQPDRGPDHAKALEEARIQAQADIESVFKPAKAPEAAPPAEEVKALTPAQEERQWMEPAIGKYQDLGRNDLQIFVTQDPASPEMIRATYLIKGEPTGHQLFRNLSDLKQAIGNAIKIPESGKIEDIGVEDYIRMRRELFGDKAEDARRNWEYFQNKRKAATPAPVAPKAEVLPPAEWEKRGVKYARRPDGTLKTKEEYTPEEWKAYTDSVIEAKLKAAPAPAPPPKPQVPSGPTSPPFEIWVEKANEKFPSTGTADWKAEFLKDNRMAKWSHKKDELSGRTIKGIPTTYRYDGEVQFAGVKIPYEFFSNVKDVKRNSASAAWLAIESEYYRRAKGVPSGVRIGAGQQPAKSVSPAATGSVGMGSGERTGVKPKPELTTPPAAAKVESEVQKVARTEGQRSAKEIKGDLVEKLNLAAAQAPANEEFNSITGAALTDKAKKAKGTITINIPGDGDFTLINRKENLESVRDAAKQISTSAGGKVKVSTAHEKTTVAEDAEAAAKAYGSPEAAYRSVRRQKKALQDQEPPASSEDRKTWNDQIESADYLARELYGKTKAGELESKAEASRDRVATYKEGAKGFEKEIARIQAIKRKTQAHKDRLADLEERYQQNQAFIRTNEANAEKWEQEAAREKAKLESQPTPPEAQAGEGLKPGEGAGPGAAPVGDVPQDPQIVQLTKALQNVDSQPIPFRERMREMLNLSEHQSLAKTAIGKSLDGLKTARDFLIRKWDGVKDWDDVKRVKGELSAEINERGWSLRQFENKAKRDVPRKRDQEAISSWLDTGGNPELLKKAEAETAPRYKQSYRDAQNLSPEMRANAENIRSYFESRLQEAIDAGVLKDGIEDYIHRIYKRDTPEKQRILNQVQSGVLNTRNPGLAMQRVFGFDYEAEKAGLPIVKSFIPRIVDYEYSLARVIADRKAVKQFMGIKMPDGRPMIDVAGIGSPVENAEGITEAMLIKPSFKRGDPNETGSKNYRRDYLQRNDYPAFRKWKWIERDPVTGRDTFVEGDVLVHPKAVDRIDALMAKSAIRRSKLGSAALGASSIFKQTMLDFSGFHQVQIAVHGMEHRVMPWGAVKDIDLSDPKVQGLLKGGLNIGGDFHAFDYREGLVGHSLSRLIPGIGEVMQAYHEYLFRDYIPRVKTTMALHALERNRARMPNLSQEQLNYLTAKQANAAFGGLNYIVMERSKTAQDLARLIFLAPDFLEARGSFAAQSMQRAGKKGEWSNEQRTALFLGAATMWITARIANKLNDDQWHFEPENAFSLVHNGRAYSLRTVQGDLLHLWDNTFQFFLNRLNPVFGRTALEMASGRDYFGRKRSRMELAWDLFANIRPIAFRSNQERRLLESIANSFGLQVKRWNDTDKAFDLAKKWKDEHGVGERGEFIYDAEKDPLRPLKLALTSNDDGLATKEIRKLFQSGYDRGRLVNYFRRYFNMPFTGSFANDAKWKKTLTEDQLKTVETAAEHKKSVARLFVKALGNYDAALKGQ